jgi:hypothetical protein
MSALTKSRKIKKVDLDLDYIQEEELGGNTPPRRTNATMLSDDDEESEHMETHPEPIEEI